MTLLQLVNSVLLRLREDEVTSYDQSNYAKLIAQFINQTKREVEDSWKWIQLRKTIQIETVAGVFRYELTDAGKRYKTLQVVNDTHNYELTKGPYEHMNKLFTMIGSGAEPGSPRLYDINGHNSATGDPYVDMYPVPDAVEQINFNLVVPQEDLADDGDTLIVPHWPVILGAHARAISERGEDGGQSFAEVMTEYTRALSDAIAIDSANVPHELVWEVV